MINGIESRHNKMHMLFVEDDEMLGSYVNAYLRQCQYNVRWIKDGLTAWTSLQSEHFDIVLLDLGLPRFSGEEVLKSMRLKGIKTPVIILTIKSCIADRVKGLDSGADGYIVKPFDIEELQARIRSVQRRVKPSIEPTIAFGNLVLNPKTRLVSKSGREIRLMRREFLLLQMLMENAECILSREQIAQRLYDFEDNTSSNTIEVHIHNIRKKCRANIITLRGIGYKLQS